MRQRLYSSRRFIWHTEGGGRDADSISKHRVYCTGLKPGRRVKTTGRLPRYQFQLHWIKLIIFLLLFTPCTWWRFSFQLTIIRHLPVFAVILSLMCQPSRTHEATVSIDATVLAWDALTRYPPYRLFLGVLISSFVCLAHLFLLLFLFSLFGLGRLGWVALNFDRHLFWMLGFVTQP